MPEKFIWDFSVIKPSVVVREYRDDQFVNFVRQCRFMVGEIRNSASVARFTEKNPCKGIPQFFPIKRETC